MSKFTPFEPRFMPGQDLSDGETAEHYQERVAKLLEGVPEISEEEEIMLKAKGELK